MPKSKWETYDKNIVGNCDATRQIVGGLPSWIKKNETSLKVVRDVESFPPPEVSYNFFTLINKRIQVDCNCSGEHKCCVRVKCIDSSQKGEQFYKVETLCQDICPLFSTRVYEEFDSMLIFLKCLYYKNFFSLFSY